MKREKLSVEKRKVLGKKVKKLRREGILPANVYGKDIKSLAVQLPQKDFEKVFKEAGETGLVDIQVDSQTIPVLIHNVQTDYLGNYLHADFYKVNLKEKVKTMVPILIVGEPKAVVDKVGLLMNILSEIEVEALPETLPDHIGVNVENLAAVDEQITVEDVKTPEGVTILSDPSQVIVKIGELVSKEAVEQATQEAAAKEEAKAEAAAEAGEPAEEAAEDEEAKEEEEQKGPARSATQSVAGGEQSPKKPQEEQKKKQSKIIG